MHFNDFGVDGNSPRCDFYQQDMGPNTRTPVNSSAFFNCRVSIYSGFTCRSRSKLNLVVRSSGSLLAPENYYKTLAIKRDVMLNNSRQGVRNYINSLQQASCRHSFHISRETSAKVMKHCCVNVNRVKPYNLADAERALI